MITQDMAVAHPAGDDQEYTVCISVKGQVLISVKANNFDEAKRKACSEVCDMDFGSLEDVNWDAVYAEDSTDTRNDF